MTVSVSPTTASTHHISLQDVDGYVLGLIVASARAGGDVDRDIKLLARSPIDRTAMKTSSGDTEYSDWRPPYYALKQDDFSGGRGSDDFNKDKTKFYDAGGLNTRRPGYLHLNGQEQFSGLLRAGGQIQPGSMERPVTVVANCTEWATKCVVSSTTTYNQIWFFSHLDYAITGIKLYDGAGTAFQTPIVTDPVSLVSIPPSYAPGWHIVNLTTPITINSTNGIWISIPFIVEDKIASDAAITGYVKIGVTTFEDYGFPCRIVTQVAPTFSRFFKYLEMIFLCQTIAGVTHIWKNGYSGMISTGGTLTATDAAKTFTTNELAGKIFMVMGGTGFSQHQRWRKIASNTATQFTFTEAFDAALDNTTFYVILGSDVWTEITSHGLSGYVTDILVSDEGVVYFAAGSAFGLIKMYMVTTTAVLTWAADAAAPGPSYMCEVGTTIWGIGNTNATQAISAAAGTTPTDAVTNPRVWGAAIPCGDRFSPVRGLMAYTDGGGYKAAMVFREGEFGFISQGVYNKVQLDELKAMSSERNGRVNLVHDTSAYFSFGPGLERWYYPNLDDVGVNRDDGLPAGRQGPVRCVAGYPGRFFMGIDAGTTGYSSVFSSGGWHEEWRGAYGQRVTAIMPQTIPSTDTLDRLWIASGGDITYMPLPSETGNMLNDSNMLYQAGGYITLSTMMTEMKTVLKYISLIRLFFQATPVASCLEVQYKINGGAWTDLDSTANPVTTDQTVVRYNLTNVVSDTGYYGIKAYSIQIRIKLFTTSKTTTPVMLAFVMELLARIDNKYAYTIPFMLEGTAIDPARDLNSVNDDIPAADTKLDKLIAWASAGSLYMRSQDTRFHNKMVLLLPFTETLTEYNTTSGQKQYLGQLTLQDS